MSYKEEIDELSVKSFKSRYSDLISYLKTVLEYQYRRFSGISVFHGQIIIWILKLPSKTAKLQGKCEFPCKHSGSKELTAKKKISLEQPVSPYIVPVKI